ncbi:MAG: phosphoribosylformylglycinamidine synthase subunit PurQ [Alphaproteobacteria bacterium]
MKSAVIRFPASNCDRDAQTVLAATGLGPVMVWHRETTLPKVDLVMLPGGFSYGDYLRSGAMAANSPIMQEVKKHAERGGLVLGVCNGFQVLTEAKLLPGVLMRNSGLKFVCKEVFLRVDNNTSAFTKSYAKGQVLNIPVAHHDGNYFADKDTLAMLEGEGLIAFRYTDANGNITPEANPNGSQLNIAGICNRQGNVLGMMPHPERHAEAILGGLDGTPMFKGLAA